MSYVVVNLSLFVVISTARQGFLFCNKVIIIIDQADLSSLWKESLNGNGHQFHQYQQSEQSPLIVTELTEQ
jgi:hypothetical protein